MPFGLHGGVSLLETIAAFTARIGVSLRKANAAKP